MNLASQMDLQRKYQAVINGNEKSEALFQKNGDSTKDGREKLDVIEPGCEMGALLTEWYIPHLKKTKSSWSTAFPYKKDTNYDENKVVYLLTAAHCVTVFHGPKDKPVRADGI